MRCFHGGKDRKFRIFIILKKAFRFGEPFLQEVISLNHDICLNIHYSAPQEIWDRINEIYKSMPYWAERENSLPQWCGENINLVASVESGGIQISGDMPENIWNDWIKTLTDRLTKALGYQIGQPEDGYKFKFWKPFEKKYSDIKSIDEKQIVFKDYSTFLWGDFDSRERNISGKPPYFHFFSPLIELYVYFDDSKVFSGNNKKNFHEFQQRLGELGIKTLDLT